MILLIPVGTVNRTILEVLRQSLEDAFRQRTLIGNPVALPEMYLDRYRNQYLASKIIEKLPRPSSSDNRLLGVVDADLFAPGLNFIFGQADISGRRTIISLPRLRQEFYDLPSDKKLFEKRIVKEAVHELGHTYGLEHCPNPNCVMHFSNSLSDTDLKGWNFCRACTEEF